MTTDYIVTRLQLLVRKERGITIEVLQLIFAAEKLGIPTDSGYPSTFEWLVKHLGFSHSAAHRRLQAARLMHAVPEAKEKLLAGSVNLTSLAQAQTTIRKSEKINKRSLPVELKVDLVQKIENTSPMELDKTLATFFPEVIVPRRDRVQYVSNSDLRFTIHLTEESFRLLERSKQLLSHTMIDKSWGDLIGRIARDYVQRHDPILVRERATRRAAAAAARRETQRD